MMQITKNLTSPVAAERPTVSLKRRAAGRFLTTSGIKRVCGHNYLHHGGLDDCYGEQGGGGDDLKESHSIDNNVVECLLETGVELLERSRRGL